MSRLGRYWIFFVIVAVGLALSWGQVGRKAQRALEASPVVFLATEPGCRARIAPCAAVASDRALVLGPDSDGLRLRQAGLAATAIVRVEVVFLAADGSELGDRVLVSAPDGWRIKGLTQDARSLRVRVLGNGDTTVADFSL